MYSCGPRTGVHYDKKEDAVILPCGGTSDPLMNNTSITTFQKHGRELFKQNCAVCHTVSDQHLTGPGLKGVLDRLPNPSEEYFRKYITNNDSLLKKDDPYLLKLKATYKFDFIHNFGTYLNDDDIRDLLTFIKMTDKPVILP